MLLRPQLADEGELQALKIEAALCQQKASVFGLPLGLVLWPTTPPIAQNASI